jgi:hypothetical protein
MERDGINVRQRGFPCTLVQGNLLKEKVASNQLLSLAWRNTGMEVRRSDAVVGLVVDLVVKG